MRKSKKDDSEFDVSPLKFTKADMKDGLLNYTYEIRNGVGAGNTHTVKGKGLFEDDLSEAFLKLNVHLSAIDDVFKHSGLEITNIEKMKNNPLVALFGVSGFALSGHKENLTVQLFGHKVIDSSSSWMEIDTPKILLSEFSSYKWAKKLKEAIDDVLEEVEEYHNGKFTEPEKAEKGDVNQTSLLDENQKHEPVDFEKGKVK